MNSSKLTIGLIFILLVLAGCSKSPVGQALEGLDTGEAQNIGGQLVINHGDVFSETPIFFINNQEDAKLYYGSNSKITFTPSVTKGVVHSTGYYLSKTGWKPFTFTGSQLGDWISAPATAAVTEDQANLNKETIVLAYVCQYVGTDWKCGCLDAAGKDCNHYMAQSFENAGSAVVSATSGSGLGSGFG